jgi:3-deoxy-7-phosphoheptulonate synthase
LQNPIGVKISDKSDPAKLVSLITQLNPSNTPGRLVVVIRMGAGHAGQIVTWVSDPMHGNTETCNVNGVDFKTRRYFTVLCFCTGSPM